MQDLENKIAVVTGGASGIGRALLTRFGQAGMKLVLVDIEEGPLKIAATELRAEGFEVLAKRVDVADAAEMDDLAKAVLDELGGVHLVCNNAGVASGGPMWTLTTADWEFAMRPNLWGVIHGVRVFTNAMLAQNEGHIVNTASMAGLVSVPGLGPYNVTKHAVVTLSETLYGELEAEGTRVGVSVLCPGFVSTRIWESERNRPEELQNDVSRPTPEERALSGKQMRAFLEGQMPASEVADLVHDAVIAKRFYILTHDGTAAAVTRRMASIVDQKAPGLPDAGTGVFSR
jgi:NAD(P)-dependent dehydrogenase (short-subunit alcohol dehydrogenase family)